MTYDQIIAYLYAITSCYMVRPLFHYFHVVNRCNVIDGIVSHWCICADSNLCVCVCVCVVCSIQLCSSPMEVTRVGKCMDWWKAIRNASRQKKMYQSSERSPTELPGCDTEDLPRNLPGSMIITNCSNSRIISRGRIDAILYNFAALFVSFHSAYGESRQSARAIKWLGVSSMQRANHCLYLRHWLDFVKFHNSRAAVSRTMVLKARLACVTLMNETIQKFSRQSAFPAQMPQHITFQWLLQSYFCDNTTRRSHVLLFTSKSRYPVSLSVPFFKYCHIIELINPHSCPYSA